MFEFFEKVAGEIGFKLINNFSNKVEEWIKRIFTECKEVDSGDYAKNASSGNYAQNASSGYNAQNASSGYNAKNASSGNYAQNASSGYNAQNASSGDYAKNASSGNYAKNASSGYNAQNASSGDNAKNASSGNYAQNASSGDNAKNASSGDNAKNVISGKNSICFDCGYKGIIKAVKGTWIALAEYKRNKCGDRIPIFARSAQIGNKEYKDFNGRVLKEDTYYILWQREFYPVIDLDGILTIKLTEKKRDNITIIKAIDVDDIYIKKPEEIKEIYIAKEDELTAHGYTLREAIEDLTLKKLDNIDVNELVKEIKKTGKVTRSQYRAITGACSFGTNKFCEQHNIQDLEEIELEKLRKILINDYGAEKFWKLIDEK
jgi:hypothetical protein